MAKTEGFSISSVYGGILRKTEAVATLAGGPLAREHLSLLGLTDSLALLAGPASILFFSLTAGEAVQGFSFHHLDAEHCLPESEPQG